MMDREPEIVEEIVRVPAIVSSAAASSSANCGAARHSVVGLTRASICSLELAEDLGDVGSVTEVKKQGPETFTTR